MPRVAINKREHILDKTVEELANEIEEELKNLWFTVFKFENLPDTISQRFLMKKLYFHGSVVFFQDDILGNLVLEWIGQSGLNHYEEYDVVRAFSASGYSAVININLHNPNADGVIIWVNYLGLSPAERIRTYALRLANMEKTIDLNVDGQKTPFVIEGTKDQKTTIDKILQNRRDYKPEMIIKKDSSMAEGLNKIDLNVEFLADKLYDLKRRVLNDALSFIGIDNNTGEKKERQTVDEVMVNSGLSTGQRNVKLQPLQESIDRINIMFKLDIKIKVSNELITDVKISKEDSEVNDGGDLDE